MYQNLMPKPLASMNKASRATSSGPPVTSLTPTPMKAADRLGLHKSRFVCHGQPLRRLVLNCAAVDTASLATWVRLGKLFSVATLVGFGEKRCRKKHRLDDFIQ